MKTIRATEGLVVEVQPAAEAAGGKSLLVLRRLGDESVVIYPSEVRGVVAALAEANVTLVEEGVGPGSAVLIKSLGAEADGQSRRVFVYADEIRAVIAALVEAIAALAEAEAGEVKREE